MSHTINNCRSWIGSSLAGLMILIGYGSGIGFSPVQAADEAKIPAGYAELDIPRMQPRKMTVPNLPGYLENAIRYAWVKPPAQGNERNVEYGGIEMTVKKPGRVYIALSQRGPGRAGGPTDWEKEILTVNQRVNQGWTYLGKCPWIREPCDLFVRDCEAGENYILRSSQYRTPQVVLGPNVDLLDEKYQPNFKAKVIREMFVDRIREMRNAEKYEELEALGRKLRQKHPKFTSGESQLVWFYWGILRTRLGYGAKDLQELTKTLRTWRQKSPRAVVPRVALAVLLSLTSNPFPNETAAEHAQRTGDAKQILIEAQRLAPDDLFLQQSLLNKARSEGKDDQVKAIAKRCGKTDPYAFDVLVSASRYFLNQTSIEERNFSAIKDFLKDMEGVLGKQAGAEFYAYTVAHHTQGVQPATLFADWCFSWDTTRAGILNYVKRRPHAWQEHEQFLKMARWALDLDVTRTVFEQLQQTDAAYGISRQITFKFLLEGPAHPKWTEGEQRTLIYAHSVPVEDVAFSPDGKRIVSGCSTGADPARVWDARTGKLIAIRTTAANRVQFFAGSSVVVTFSGLDTVSAWHIEENTYREIGSHADPDHPTFLPLRGLAPAADGSFLVTGDSRGLVKIWDGSTGRLKNKFSLPTLKENHGISDLALSPDKNRLAAVGSGGLVIYNLKAGKVEQSIIAKRGRKLWEMASVDFSPDGKLVAFGVGGQVRVFDVATLKRIAFWNRPNLRIVRDIKFTPDGKRLGIAICDGDVTNFSGKAILWAFGTKKPPQELKGHVGGVTSLDFSPDGKSAVTAGHDWSVRIWDLAKLE